jgi:hypothetical protein
MQHFANPFTTAEVNGLITPLTQPSSTGSCYQEGFKPLEEIQRQNLDTTYASFSGQTGHNLFWPSQHNLVPHYPVNQAPSYQISHSAVQETPFTYTSAPDMYTGTAPPTPDLLATPRIANVKGQDSLAAGQTDDEVLVGMGLYDAPSMPHPASLPGGQIVLPYRGSAGKGLKLEETFQPSNEDGSDEDDGSSDDQAEEIDLNQPAPNATTYQKAILTDPMGAAAITTLADQSFFFENDPDDDQFLQQTYEHHCTAPVWTDVYSGAPCQWI